MGFPLGYPNLAIADFKELLGIIERDDTFVSESHPRFTNGNLVTESFTSFEHCYVRLEPDERAATVRTALAIIRCTNSDTVTQGAFSSARGRGSVDRCDYLEGSDCTHRVSTVSNDVGGWTSRDAWPRVYRARWLHLDARQATVLIA